MPPYPLTNFERQKYYQNEPKFNVVYSKNNLPKMKDRTYVINFDEFRSIGAYSKRNLKINSNKILLQIFIKYKHTIR